jgi:hypothetical protein
MSTYAPPSDALRPAPALGDAARRLAARLPLRRATAFGLIMLGALVAFEFFNYGTTEFALRDLMGDLTFGPARWSVVLALAFCGMDFAGIARLLTPERTPRAPSEAWYLLGAWAVAAAMNGMLTWWAVSLAVVSHAGLGNEIVSRQELIRMVPVFVALLVLLIRVLIIGSFTLSGSRMFASDERRTPLMLRPLAVRSQRPGAMNARSAREPSPSPVPAFVRGADRTRS